MSIKKYIKKVLKINKKTKNSYSPVNYLERMISDMTDYISCDPESALRPSLYIVAKDYANALKNCPNKFAVLKAYDVFVNSLSEEEKKRWISITDLLTFIDSI